jgi:hypothetical protein
VTTSTKQLDDRVHDLNALLSLIAQFEAQKSGESPGSDLNNSVGLNASQLSVLKASVFLVAYNLIESTVRAAFESLYARIQSDRVSYSRLSKEIRELWVDQQMKSSIDAFTASPRTYRDKMHVLLELADQGSVVELSKKYLPVSGNLDAVQIRKVCEKHGMRHATPTALKGGADLEIVREQRNNLAHGSITFSECGRQYTVSDLERITSQCEQYVRYILKVTERFATGKHYLAKRVRKKSA